MRFRLLLAPVAVQEWIEFTLLFPPAKPPPKDWMRSIRLGTYHPPLTFPRSPPFATERLGGGPILAYGHGPLTPTALILTGDQVEVLHDGGWWPAILRQRKQQRARDGEGE